MSTEDLPTGGLRLVSDEGRTITHPSMRGHKPHDGAAAVDAAALDEEGSDAGTVDLITIDALDADLSARDQQAELFAAIEAVLMVAEEPVSAEVLATVTTEPVPTVEQACAQIAHEYAATGRGFSIVRVAGGYQLQSAVAAADYVERFLGGRRSARLSAAAMETLALVAYKQPISRAQISAIRGVNADGVVRTLSDQGYLTEIGRDPGPGTASLLGTTDLLLQRLGLDSLDDLPSLSELSVDPDAVEAMDRIAAERTG